MLEKVSYTFKHQPFSDDTIKIRDGIHPKHRQGDPCIPERAYPKGLGVIASLLIFNWLRRSQVLMVPLPNPLVLVLV
jgi:hypothetical protein